MLEQKIHTPVMLKEVLDYLNPRDGLIIVDATIGTGGHSLAILNQIGYKGRLIGIDRDEESLNNVRQRLKEFLDNITLVHGNFSNIDNILKDLDTGFVDGILFDLGLSSFQLENKERGFSFQLEGPLDMRLDKSSYISAYDLVNNLNEEEISNLLWTFGQERWHNRIARNLVKERERHMISTTLELADIVFKAMPHRYSRYYYRIHPATRTFQALRIAVNRELESLAEALNKSIGLLKKNARLCVISFHSLEDRIVKLSFRKFASQGWAKIITPKPLIPTRSEIQENPRSRSSKFRVLERL